MMSVFLVFALMGLMAVPAMADGLALSYQGSFYAASGHYGKGLTYVADGVGSGDRPGTVTGPTILTAGGHGGSDDLREWYIPALVTTGAPVSATRVPYAGATEGGTNVVNLNVLGGTGGAASIAVMGGEVWRQVAEDRDVVCGLGLIKLGSNETWNGGTGVSSAQTYGTPTGAYYVSSGLAEKWDETDTLLRTSWNYSAGGQTVYVSRHVKGAGGVGGDPNEYSWTTTPVFSYFSADAAYRRGNLEYVDIGGDKYYVLCTEVQNTAVLDFFNASTATGSVVAPDFSIDVTSDITNGVGWFYLNSRIRDLAYDGDSTFYLMDSATGGGDGTRVHVFTVEIPPVAEPAGLGIAGLILMTLKRRRK